MGQMKIYEAIRKVALSCAKSGDVQTRADLAYELKEMGIASEDDARLSEMVYRAYLHYNRDNDILKSFVTNDGASSIVDQYEVNAHLDDDNLQEALSVIEKDLTLAKDNLQVAERDTESVLRLELLKAAGGVLKELEGTQQLTQIREKSATLMQNYGKMIDSYQSAEKQVKIDIKDFVDLRGAVSFMLQKYAVALVDVFGESIKVIDPNLFDFSKVKWLDVKNMKSQAELKFNQLDQECTLLVGEVAEHFSQTMNQIPLWMKSSKALGAKSGLYGTLVVGVISYLNHWLATQEKSMRMETEYAKLKNSILKDRVQVKSDMMRLTSIHKTLNDLYIPKAEAFLRLSEQVLSDDLNNLIESLYSNETAQLKQERDAILARLKELERSINDHNENLTLYDGQLKDLNGLLDSQKEYYQAAVSQKPEEPNILTKVFLQEKYKKKLHEWVVKNGSLVTAYEDMKVDVELAKESLATHKSQIEADKKEYDSLRRKLADLNTKIASKLTASPQQKLEVLKNLKGLLSLLHAGKSVVESKLDESMLEVVQVAEPNFDNELPAELVSKYQGFCDGVVSEVRASGVDVASNVLRELGLEGSDVAQQVSETSQMAMDKLANLLQNASYLQSEQMRSQLTEEVYRRELERMQEEFKKSLSNISNQSDALLKALGKANTATNKEDLRKALIELSGGKEYQFTESDFDAMLRGEKTIEI